MKNLLIIILLCTSYFCSAQEVYYTTDGKNRISKAEVDSIRIGVAKRISKKIGRKLYANVQINKIIEKKDSIIKKVTFKLSDKNIEGEVHYKRLMEHLYDKELPNFNLKALTSSNLDSKSLKGKPTMINFWFTQCPPCVDEMPFLNKLKDKYKDKINFISITYENKDNVEEFLKNHSFDFKHLINAKQYTDKLKVKAYPLNIFLDENRIVKHVDGGLMYFKDKDGKMKIKDAKVFEKVLNKLI